LRLWPAELIAAGEGVTLTAFFFVALFAFGTFEAPNILSYNSYGEKIESNWGNLVVK
jgi:hypothetical protein